MGFLNKRQCKLNNVECEVYIISYYPRVGDRVKGSGGEGRE